MSLSEVTDISTVLASFGAVIAAIIAIISYLRNLKKDRVKREIEYRNDLKLKRTDSYLLFLEELSVFISDINNSDNKVSFLNLCYKMVLISSLDIKNEIEKLINYILEYGAENKEEVYFREKLEEDKIISKIIELMRAETHENEEVSSAVEWMGVIEYLSPQKTSLSEKEPPVSLPPETGATGDIFSESTFSENSTAAEDSEDSKTFDQTRIVPVLPVDKPLAEEYIDHQVSNSYWINANSRHVGKAWEKMIENNVVCTYGPQRYGKKLEKLQKLDRVFLYLSGKGIIATGVVDKAYSKNKNATPITLPPDSKVSEYSVEVIWDTCIDSEHAISPREIKKLGHKLFLPTLIALSKGLSDKLLELIKSRPNKHIKNRPAKSLP